MMRTLLLSIVTSIILTITLAAQTDADRARAREACRRGIEAVDEGDLEKGLDLIQQAAALDPANANYKYEQAYVHVMKAEYQVAIDMMKPLMQDTAAHDMWYQLIGNCYDYLGNPKKAVAMYSAGLRRFPDSGPLHLELGVMAAKADSIALAVNYWEEGIRHAPRFPSNYYWAAKAFCSGTAKLWGVIYAEIFLNLEPTSKRSREISKLLFKTYAEAITIGRDSSRIDFLESLIMDRKDALVHKSPYTLDFTLAMTISTDAGVHKGDGNHITMTVERLHAIRQAFIKLWYERGLDTTHANVLYAYQKQLIDAGHFEAYDRYLFREANSAELDAWMEKNDAAMTSWIEWQHEHAIGIGKRHYFSRLEEK